MPSQWRVRWPCRTDQDLSGLLGARSPTERSGRLAGWVWGAGHVDPSTAGVLPRLPLGMPDSGLWGDVLGCAVGGEPAPLRCFLASA